MKNKGTGDFFDDPGEWESDPLNYYASATNGNTKGKSHYYAGARCHESHKPLTVGEHQIWGGSCISPAKGDFDIYIGFDRGMQVTPRSFPWTPGIEFMYPISDGTAPSNPDTFKQLVAWASLQLIAGKKIHCGCIGGHGRTGLFLAALVTEVTGDKDSITYVREHYCNKAIETDKQIKFLEDHFGIKGAKARKSFLPLPASGKGLTTGYSGKQTVFEPLSGQRYTLFTS